MRRAVLMILAILLVSPLIPIANAIDAVICTAPGRTDTGRLGTAPPMMS